MATNQAVRAALLGQLGVTRQRLSQLASQRKAILPMTTEDAVYTIAVDNGIDISRFLAEDDTARVRAIMAQLRSASQTRISNTAEPTKSRDGGQRAPVSQLAGVNVDCIPGLSKADVQAARRIAESAYPMLYLFENSLRGIIELVLSHHFGPSWWSKSIPNSVRQSATIRKSSESKDAWHKSRGSRDIDYVDLLDLWTIVNHQWGYFKKLFPRRSWIEDIITSDMNISRRQIAHMNSISVGDVKNMEAAFWNWIRQLKGVSHLIP